MKIPDAAYIAPVLAQLDRLEKAVDLQGAIISRLIGDV